MARPGRPPLPTRLKVLHGEQHRSRLNFDEPQPTEGAAQKPPSLSDDAAAIWDQYVRELQQMRLWRPIDSDQLAAYCEHVAVFRRAARVVARSGVLVEGSKKQIIRNPAVMAMRDAAIVMRAYAQEFGFTPSARSRITVGASEQQTDPRERLLS